MCDQGKTYQSLDQFLRDYPNYFRRQPRTTAALSALIQKYDLRESYDALCADPAIAARILRCDDEDTESENADIDM
jgi:hypothetical protein